MSYSQPSRAALGRASELNGWLRTYSRSPVAAGKEIRALAEEDKEQFYFHAFPVIRRFDASPGVRFLVLVMLERALLLRALCEPALPDQRVCAVLRALFEDDAEADMTLVRAVLDQAQAKQQPAGRNPLLRVLNNLERLTDAKRVAPRLLPLLRHADPRIRSKVVGIIGRCGKNTRWVARQLTDPDPRIRANAIEALWGVDDEVSRELLKSALQDSNNRVVGNALLELYRMGDCSSITELLRLASEGNANFRSTAAWVMGESGDPRFREALKALADGDNSVLRRRAALALEQVEAEAAKPESGVPWRMAVLRDLAAETAAEPDFDGEKRCLTAAVLRDDGRQPSAIPSTQFRIFEDQHPILVYNVETVEVPEKFVMAFVMPAMDDASEFPIINGALRALAWKRPADLWASVRYKPPRRWNLRATLIGEIIEIAPPEEIPAAVEPPVFLADEERLAETLEEVPEGPPHRTIWDAIVESHRACAAIAFPDAEAHLVIFGPGDAGTPPEPQLRRLEALSSDVAVHCIALEANPAVEALCRRGKGSYHLVADSNEVVEAMEWLYVRLLARYRVTYQGTPRATSSHIQVRTSEGWGKAIVLYGRDRSRFLLSQ